jgi:hypothetical protein
MPELDTRTNLDSLRFHFPNSLTIEEMIKYCLNVHIASSAPNSLGMDYGLHGLAAILAQIEGTPVAKIQLEKPYQVKSRY